MAKAIAARQQGDEYQARFFWMEACRLFHSTSVVTRIGFEVDGARAFDDVVTFYDHKISNEAGQAIRADFYQIKFHVTMAGAFTADALIDPEFIGASSVSLLERLRDAQQKHAPEGYEARFTIVSSWTIDPNDKLAELISGNGGQLDPSRVFTSGPRSDVGKIRKRWRERVGVTNDRELARIIEPLRLRFDFPPLEGLREQLDMKLRYAGLVPMAGTRRASVYDDLPRKLLQEGRREFTREQLDEILHREGLREGQPVAPAPPARRIGIRSFMRWAEHMEDETEAMHCFAASFDGRFLKAGVSWQNDALPALNAFLNDSAGAGSPVQLQLDTHMSLAFAAGWQLDSKSGVNVWPVQRGGGTHVWDARAGRCSDARVWDEHMEASTSAGTEIAVVLSVTHDIRADAHRYVKGHLGSVGHILALTVCDGARPTSVRDGPHALRLAQDAVAAVAQCQREVGATGMVHVFGAAPNGFMFFLGQNARRLGACALYEHDFERGKGGLYEPSVMLQ